MQVYGQQEYIRHLTGELKESQPIKCIKVTGFGCRDDFKEWCINQAEESTRTTAFFRQATRRAKPFQ